MCRVNTALVHLAYAQTPPTPPPVFPTIDERGVDVPTGAFVHTLTDVAIGQPGAGGLAFTRYYRYQGGATSTHNHNGYLFGNGTTCYVVLGANTETFTSTGSNCTGTFTSQQQVGSTLVYTAASQTFAYTMRDGTAVSFALLPTYSYVFNQSAVAYITSVTSPAAEVTTYSYEWQSVCVYGCYLTLTFGRVKTVYNNLGYRLWFDYSGTPHEVLWYFSDSRRVFDRGA